MKYAIISDIHGNLSALRAVLQDAEKANVDKYIYVGDYFLSLPYPNQVVEELKNNKKAYIVCGNEESYISWLSKQDKQDWTDGQFGISYWCFDEMTNDTKEFLTSLPKELAITDFETKIHITHSSKAFFGDVEMQRFSGACIDDEYKETIINRAKIQNYIDSVLDTDKIFNESLGKLDDGVYIFGHSHVQWHSMKNGKLFINPGSCGLPVDFVSGAPYTILNIAEDDISVDERRVEYDVEETIKTLQSSGAYKKAKVWCDVIIKELRTNREHLSSFLEYAEAYANKINDHIRPFTIKTWCDAYDDWITL
ncbi:MAG: hypothetical protein CVU97_05710 [Firmicutes bacterium HGW-Firmicutes-21]|nr:MAG: hypothetical protein CVU97_05710 [Firmicutes bacterium HGW-Firmicutes-21]